MDEWLLNQTKPTFCMQQILKLTAVPEAKNWLYDGTAH